MASDNEKRGPIELLSEDNYSTWKMQMEALLIKKELWDHVKEKKTLSSISDESEKGEWLQNDKEAKCEFILSISPSELKHIRNCQTSNEIWVELESIYELRDKAKKRALFKQLVLHHSTDDSDIINHTTEFCNIVNKLENMNVVIDKELLVTMFLQNLPHSYDNFKYAIELQKQLPTLEILKIKIMDYIKVKFQKSESESKPNEINHFDIEQPL